MDRMRGGDASLRSVGDRRADARASSATSALEAILLAVLVPPLAVAIAALAWRSTLMAPINYNEGCNAFFVSEVLAGAPLYFPPDALVTNNYPPLSFYLEAPIASLMGDAIFAGRLVSWLAFAAVTGFIVAISHRLHGDRIAALFSGMIFAGFLVINYDIYVGMNDPQMLAHAIMLAGLWILLRSRNAVRAAIAASMLMAAALFAKHNIVALPLAVATWLAIYNRRAAVTFIAAGVVTGAVGGAVCLAAFGHDFIWGLLAPRRYVPERAWRHAIEWLLPIEVPVLLAFLGATIDRSNRYTLLFALYLLIALGLAWLLAGGFGVNFNLMFEVVIAFALAAGQLIARLRGQRPLRRWALGAYALAALVGAGLVGGKDQLLLRPWIATERAREAATAQTVRMIADRPGPALCENPVLCYWAGKPMELDPLNFEEGVAAGTKDENLVLERIASGHYTVIEFPPNDPAVAGFVGTRLAAAVAARYQPLSNRPDGSIVYVRRH
jgi:Dolichyl-phosphate-mannose-protein mannosyltransferase